MRIIVHGMGIIGGSLAASLKAAGHTVLGRNRSEEPLAYALANGMIDGVTKSYEGADVVFLALPPRVVMRILDEEDFPQGCIVADVCGVKRAVAEVVLRRPRAYRYVGLHPMAGKETSGIRSASAALFRGANLVMVEEETTDRDAVASLRELAAAMGFGRIVVCDAAEHDRMIALTSQLAHIVSNGYIKTPLAAGCGGFTGGSFQDMTRVAPVDAALWAELFSLNRDALAGEIGRLMARLGEYLAALEADDEAAMRDLLAEGRRCHQAFTEASAGENAPDPLKSASFAQKNSS